MTRTLCWLAAVSVSCALTSLTATGAGQVDDFTKERVLAAIREYVESDIALKGKFLVLDPKSQQPLALKLDQIHSIVNPQKDGWAVCVDWKDTRGRIVDVDVVVDDIASVHPEPMTKEGMVVVDIFVHKIDGKPIASN